MASVGLKSPVIESLIHEVASSIENARKLLLVMADKLVYFFIIENVPTAQII
jgi:hypothetical protein